jgi:hypothetical protein
MPMAGLSTCPEMPPTALINRLEELLGRPLVEIFETDPDSPGGSTARPLNFQLTARNKLVDQTVRLTVGRSKA